MLSILSKVVISLFIFSINPNSCCSCMKFISKETSLSGIYSIYFHTLVYWKCLSPSARSCLCCKTYVAVCLSVHYVSGVMFVFFSTMTYINVNMSNQFCMVFALVMVT